MKRAISQQMIDELKNQIQESYCYSDETINEDFKSHLDSDDDEDCLVIDFRFSKADSVKDLNDLEIHHFYHLFETKELKISYMKLYYKDLAIWLRVNCISKKQP